MRKVHLVCSLLLAFGISVVGLGCGAKPDNKMTGPAPKLDGGDSTKTDTKKTGNKKKASGSSSTTGAGVDVPADAGGANEKPSDATETKPAPEEKKPEGTEEKKPDATEEKKPE